jgi:hypothetical protein
MRTTTPASRFLHDTLLARYATLLAGYVTLFALYDTLFARYNTLLAHYVTLLTRLHVSNTFWSQFEITWRWLKPEIKNWAYKLLWVSMIQSRNVDNTLHWWHWKSLGCNIKKKYRFRFKQLCKFLLKKKCPYIYWRKEVGVVLCTFKTLNWSFPFFLFSLLFLIYTYHFHLLMVCTSPSWFDTREHVLYMRTFQNEANYLQKVDVARL